MGRGLGDLQKSILLLALERRAQGHHFIIDVSARDVLATYYHFPFKQGTNCANHNAHVFNRTLIGKKKYMSASVTVAQCFRRLEARGLVDRLPGYGINLTKAGSEVAKNML